MKKADKTVSLRDFRKNRFQLVRPVILRGFVVIAMGVLTMASLYNALGIRPGGSEGHYFVMFTLLTGYFFSYRRFQLFIIRFVQHTVAGIRLDIMRHVRHIGLRDFENIGPEQIYLALIYDERFVTAISQYVTSVLLAAVAVITIHIYLCSLSPHAGMLSVCVYGTTCVIYGFNQIRIREMVEQVRATEKCFLESVRDLFEGFKELRLNNKKSDDFFHNGLKQHASVLRELKIQYQNVFMNNYSVAYGLFKSQLMLMVLLIPLFGIVTHDLLFAFFGCLFFMPYTVLIDRVPGIFLAAVSLRRLFELQQALENIHKEPEISDDLPAPEDFEELRYENIGFRYEGKGAFGVGPLDMTIRKGEILFIIGGNGSGKSTLVKLITGLYPMHSGRVCLNQSEIPIRDCRHLFSVIFSDYHLFARLYGADEIDGERFAEIIQMMRLAGKVELDHKKFSTVKLSAGQKKRLALTAAMMADKPIYVFDEWAADQDPEFRQYFYETLIPSFKAEGKTVIAVTHDDRWFHVADRVMKLDYGQIADS